MAPAFADPGVTLRRNCVRMRIEVNEMSHCHRRHIALPLFLILAGTLFLLGQAHVIPVVHFRNVWPLILIAIGLDQLYAWASSGSRQ